MLTRIVPTGRHVANRLLGAGEHVGDVPPTLSARTRVFKAPAEHGLVRATPWVGSRCERPAGRTFGRVVHQYGYERTTRESVVAPFDLAFLGVRLDVEEQASYDVLSRKISQARKVLLSAGGTPQRLHQQLGALRSAGGETRRAVMAYENGTRERRRLLADTRAKQEALRALVDVVGESRGSVLFTQSKESADAAARVLQEGGLRAAAIYSEGMTPGQRQSLIDYLHDEKLDALAAPRILDEGVDIPDIDLGVVMGASTRRKMIQRLGRVIRLKADGRRARFVVLYVVGSVEDPESGGRNDFMDEVEDAASKVMLFDEWDETTIDDIWGGSAPAWEKEHGPSESAAHASGDVHSIAPGGGLLQSGTRGQGAQASAGSSA